MRSSYPLHSPSFSGTKHLRSRLIPCLRLWPLLTLGLAALIIGEWAPRLQALVLAWFCPFLVLGTMLRPTSLFSRFLELPVMRYLGRLSYSIYLWQQLFFVAHFGRPLPGWSVLQQWPLAPLLTIGCAMLSYYFIERPAIKAGHRLVETARQVIAAPA
jgi:peptidoglycan/LPS O-acetylase OafA/YrhL